MNKAYFEFAEAGPDAMARQPDAAPGQPGAEGVLLAAIARLEDVIEQENSALLTSAPVDFDEINRSKSRCLLELTRLSRTLPKGRNQALAERMAAVRVKLDANLKLVGLHLGAVREVADFIADQMGRADSDGTYSRGSFAR
jgi:hypothetical protein